MDLIGSGILLEVTFCWNIYDIIINIPDFSEQWIGRIDEIIGEKRIWRRQTGENCTYFVQALSRPEDAIII